MESANPMPAANRTQIQPSFLDEKYCNRVNPAVVASAEGNGVHILNTYESPK
jgi:hypothetical protein